MDRDDFKSLALLGARTRLEALHAELTRILAAFPELGALPAPTPSNGNGNGHAPAPTAPRRRRTRMSAAARQATSRRMKKYWRERRKAAAA